MMDELLELVKEHVVIPVVLFILNSVWPVIYHAGEWLLCAFLAIPLNLIEWLHAAVDVFSGVQTITAPNGTATDLIGYFFGQAVVMRVFWGVTLIAAALCLAFSILAVVRSMGDSGLNRPVGKVMGSTARAMVTFLLVPFMCIFAINMAGIVLRQVGSMIDGAGDAESRVYVSSALFMAAVTPEGFSPGGADTEVWAYNSKKDNFELAKPSSGMGPELSNQQFYAKTQNFLRVQLELENMAQEFAPDLEKVLGSDVSMADTIMWMRANSKNLSEETQQTLDDMFADSASYPRMKGLNDQIEELYEEFLNTPNLPSSLAAEIVALYMGDLDPVVKLSKACESYDAFMVYSTGSITPAIYERMMAELWPAYYEMKDCEAAIDQLKNNPESVIDASGLSVTQIMEEAARIISEYQDAHSAAQEQVQNFWHELLDAGVKDSTRNLAEAAVKGDWMIDRGLAPEDFDNSSKTALYNMVYGDTSGISAPEFTSESVDADLLSGMDYNEARQYILTHKLFGIIDSENMGFEDLDLFELLTYNFNFYSMFSENYFPLFIACWFYLIMLLMIFMIFIRRIFELIVLFVVSPFFVSAIPLDDGAKFKVWREQFISKAVAGFGSIITLKIFILFLPLIWNDSLKLHQGDVIDFLLKLLLMTGGIYAAYKSHTLISSIVSERGAASERESVVFMQGMMQSAKGMAMAPAGFAKMIAMDRLRSHTNQLISKGEHAVAGGVVSVFSSNKNPNLSTNSADTAKWQRAEIANIKPDPSLPQIGAHRAPPSYEEAIKSGGGYTGPAYQAPIKPVHQGPITPDGGTTSSAYQGPITPDFGDASSAYQGPIITPQSPLPAPPTPYQSPLPDLPDASNRPLPAPPPTPKPNVSRSAPPDEKNKF